MHSFVPQLHAPVALALYRGTLVIVAVGRSFVLEVYFWTATRRYNSRSVGTEISGPMVSNLMRSTVCPTTVRRTVYGSMLPYNACTVNATQSLPF